MKHKPMSQMNKEKKLKDGVITRATSEPNPRKVTTSASRIGDVPKKDKRPLPTDADLQALQDAGVDYTDFLKIFFKGKDNDK